MKMRKLVFSLAIILALAALSCSKKTDNSGSSVPLVFSTLNVSDTTMAVNGIVTLTANASGDGLSYHWTASYGSFIGSGASVKWTVCHADKFTVTCEVKDGGGNTSSKTVTIYVHE
jgi:hypothetical protein